MVLHEDTEVVTLYPVATRDFSKLGVAFTAGHRYTGLFQPRSDFCYAGPVLALRFPGESDGDFRARVERALRIAKVLASACLANRCMLRYIADPSLPHTEESVRLSPTVRVEYEEGIAIGDLGAVVPNLHEFGGPPGCPRVANAGA